MFLHKLFVILSKISTHCHTMFYLNVVHFLEWIKIQILIFFTITDPLGQSFTTLVVYLCFFITQPPYKITLSWRHIACSSLWGTRERFTCWTRVPYLWLKKKGGERGKVASALRWNKDKQKQLVLFWVITSLEGRCPLNGSIVITYSWKEEHPQCALLIGGLE